MIYKKKVVDGKEVSFSSDWIRDLEQEIHFKWYYNQASIVYKYCNRESHILEIGIGTGLLSDLLKKRAWNLKTLDIDEEKNPDFCDSAENFDYRGNLIEIILAFEIFEHIPYPTFVKVLNRFANDGIKEIYFSLPWCEKKVASLSFKLPKFPVMNFDFKIPQNKILEPLHYWELSRKSRAINEEKCFVGIELLNSLLSDCGFKLVLLHKVGSIQYFKADLVASS